MERQCTVEIMKLANGFLVTRTKGSTPFIEDGCCFQNFSGLRDWLYQHFCDEWKPEEGEAGWISVHERIPKIGQKILVMEKNGLGNPTVLKYAGSGFMWHYFWTHWKPLSNPPSCDCSDCVTNIHNVVYKNS